MIGGGNLQILNVKYGEENDADNDDATYTCRAENDVDSVDAEARLTVLGITCILILFSLYATQECHTLLVNVSVDLSVCHIHYTCYTCVTCSHH